MGLIKALTGAAGGTLADQWKEYFYCDALDQDTLVVKGQKRTTSRSSNVKGNDNIISNGSGIAVADGQCMMIVEQGKVVEVCAEPGEFTWDSSTEPSIFAGSLGQSIKDVFKTVGRRIGYGADTAKDQRVYYFNIKEIPGNKYGTANPVPFRVVDQRAGIDIDISIKCFGEYSYKMTNPLLFYTNVSGNVESAYKKSEIDSQLKTELLTALQPVFAKIGATGVRYSELAAHTGEIADDLNSELSQKWKDLRGIEVVSFGVSSVTADEEDEKMLKELQKNIAYTDPTRAAAAMVGAQAAAMQAAASNQGSGAAMAFMGMNMAANAGGANAQSLFQMGQAAKASGAPAGGWTCSCGAVNTGNFCSSCGAKRPDDSSWTCSCGAVNTGNFCSSCGAKRP